jgi:DNA-binding Lrp family transcriptional regulator
MTTRWEILFRLFEIKEIRLGDLAKATNTSPSSIQQRLKELVNLKLVNHVDKIYSPNKENPKTFNAFSIMKFCKQKGLNPNILFSEELSKIIVTGLSKGELNLEDFKGMNYKTVRKYLTYLNRMNLLFVTCKKPLKVKFVYDPVFDEILDFFGKKKPEVKIESRVLESDYDEIAKSLKKLNTLNKGKNIPDMETEMKIEFASASTQLEGNTFTLEETKDLIFHDVIPSDKKLKEANEVKNYFNAVNYLYANLEKPLSIDLILDLHRIVVYNLEVKEGVRAARVSIKGNPFYKVANFPEIFHKLDDLCKKINEFNSKKQKTKDVVEFATFVHNEFQHIHPFEDGNSRTTRLIWNYVLMKNRFPLINIYSNTKAEYLSLTKLARQRDDSKLNSFLVKIIKDNIFKQMRI